MFFPIPTLPGASPYAAKPRRSGAYVLTSDEGWIYTATPELFREEPRDALRAPFFETPPHMRPED